MRPVPTAAAGREACRKFQTQAGISICQESRPLRLRPDAPPPPRRFVQWRPKSNADCRDPSSSMVSELIYSRISGQKSQDSALGPSSQVLVARRHVFLAMACGLASGTMQVAPAQADPQSVQAFCSVTDVMPMWAINTPYEEGTLPYAGHKTWFRDINNVPSRGLLGSLGLPTPSANTDTTAPAKLPVVAVAGGSGGLPHNYLDSLELLVGVGRRVVQYDHIGSGNSYLASGRQGPPPQAFTLELLVEELRGVLQARGLSGGGYHLFGHGVGGSVALAWAARAAAEGRAPASLVLAATPASYSDLVSGRRVAAEALGEEVAGVLLGSEGDAARREQFAAALSQYNHQYVCRRRAAPQCVERARELRSGAAFQGLCGRRLFSTTGALAEWEGIPLAKAMGRVPCLVTRGLMDEVPHGSAAALAEALPAGDLREFQDAGSYAHIDRWEPYLVALDDHFSNAEGSVPASVAAQQLA